MASCQVADGKAVGADIKNAVAAELKELKEKYPDFQPQLSIIQVWFIVSSFLLVMKVLGLAYCNS